MTGGILSVFIRRRRHWQKNGNCKPRKDTLVKETLGEHIFNHFLEAKRNEWDEYIRHVSPWEMDRYLGVY